MDDRDRILEELLLEFGSDAQESADPIPEETPEPAAEPEQTEVAIPEKRKEKKPKPVKEKNMIQQPL